MVVYFLSDLLLTVSNSRVAEVYEHLIFIKFFEFLAMKANFCRNIWKNVEDCNDVIKNENNMNDLNVNYHPLTKRMLSRRLPIPLSGAKKFK